MTLEQITPIPMHENALIPIQASLVRDPMPPHPLTTIPATPFENAKDEQTNQKKYS